MAPVEPSHCRASAYQLMAAQVDHLDTTDALMAGAVAISMHEMPEVTVRAVGAEIDTLVQRIRRRFRSDSPHAILAHAHAVLFEECEFSGVIGDHDPLDSYLPAVLERKRGLPITLVLVYRLVLERFGLRVHGLNTPAHFLAGVELDDTVMIVDCASRGRVLTMAETVQHVLQHTDVKSLPENNPVPIAREREWLQRMLRNLKEVFGTRNRPAEHAAMVELSDLLD